MVAGWPAKIKHMKKTTKNNGPQLKDYKSNTYMDGDMEIRFAIGPEETKNLDAQKLAENFLVKDLMTADMIKLVYSHYDRVIIGGAKPVNKTLTLPNHPELRAEYFLERREPVSYTHLDVYKRQAGKGRVRVLSRRLSQLRDSLAQIRLELKVLRRSHL